VSETLVKDEYTWGLQDHQEWLERIKKELNSDSLSDRILHIDNDIIYDPYKEYDEDINPNIIEDYPALSIGMRLDVTNVISDNKYILKLLANDLRVIRLNISQVWDWDQLFHNIHLDLITLIIVSSDATATTSLSNYIQNLYNVGTVICNGDQILSNQIEYLGYTNYMALSKTDLFHCIHHDIAVSNSNSVYLELPISENLIDIIPFVRAIRIDIQRVNPSKKLYISAVIDVLESSDNPNHAIIRSGSIALLCSMAGVDFLFYDKTDSSDDGNHQRLLLNIQNMMELESRTHQVKDPLSGSYVIEDLTNQYLSLRKEV